MGLDAFDMIRDRRITSIVCISHCSLTILVLCGPLTNLVGPRFQQKQILSTTRTCLTQTGASCFLRFAGADQKRSRNLRRLGSEGRAGIGACTEKVEIIVAGTTPSHVQASVPAPKQ